MNQIPRHLRPQRLPKEDDIAWAALNYYLDLPDRSFAKLLELFNTMATSERPTDKMWRIKAWSSQFDWQQRIEKAEEETYREIHEAEKTELGKIARQKSQETAKDLYLQVEQCRNQVFLLGQAGTNISAKSAKITLDILEAIAKNKGRDDFKMPYTPQQIQVLMAISTVHRSLFVQGAPVSSEMVSMALGIDQVLTEMVEKSEAEAA